MAYTCEHCEKRTHTGGQHTHHTGVAGGQWKKRAQTTLRTFAPNVRMVSLPVNGVMTRMKLCTKCIKRVKFDNAKKAAKQTATA